MICSVCIQDQWISLKTMVNGQFRKLDYGSLWETLLTKVPCKDDFKAVLHIVELVLVLSISAAQCVLFWLRIELKAAPGQP